MRKCVIALYAICSYFLSLLYALEPSSLFVIVQHGIVTDVIKYGPQRFLLHGNYCMSASLQPVVYLFNYQPLKNTVVFNHKKDKTHCTEKD
jgi:hypothetical protein